MPELPKFEPIATKPISVVLIAHRAEPQLDEVVAGWVGFLNGLNRDYEILIVDDTRTESFARLAQSLVARNSRVRLVRPSKEQGQGAALRCGLAKAQFPLIVQAPCTQQYRSEDLKRLLAEVDRAHLVSGFRVHGTTPSWARWTSRIYRSIAAWLFAIPQEASPGWLGWRALARHYLARAFFGVRLKDVCCDFRLYRRAIFKRITIQSNGPFALIEVLAKANFLGCLMTEVAVPYRAPEAHVESVTAVSAWREGYRMFSRPEFGR